MRSMFTSGVGASTIDNDESPYLPAPSNVAAPHLPYHIPIAPTAGDGFLQPNRTVDFSFSIEAQLLTKVNLRMFLDRILINGEAGETVATATFARYVDYIGLACFSQARMKFGLEQLQIIRPLEIFSKLRNCYSDEQRNNLDTLLKGALTPAQRDVLRANDRQQVILPMLTLLGLHLGCDPSQNFYIRGLGERLHIEFDMEPFFHWIEGDGNVEIGTGLGTAVTATTALPAAGTVVQQGDLFCEYQFITEEEEAAHESIWSMARRYLFAEAQYVFSHVIPATTALNGADYINQQLRFDGINQPVKTVYVYFRWQDDLTRDFQGANGSRGRNLFNVGGWQNPGGVVANRSVFDQISLRVGNDNFALKATPIETLTEYEHARKFLSTGSGGVLCWTYEHLPCDENSATGYLDFSQSEKPQLILRTRNIAAVLATIGDAKAADIGGANTGDGAGLAVDVHCVTINKLAMDRNTIKHPVN